MAQAEIFNLLKSEPDKWWTAAEIMEKLGGGKNTTLKCAGQLAKYNLIDQRWDYRFNGLANKPTYVFKFREVKNAKRV
jgi:predicted DNA-binding ArsR family transcriptional regulator